MIDIKPAGTHQQDISKTKSVDNLKIKSSISEQNKNLLSFRRLEDAFYTMYTLHKNEFVIRNFDKNQYTYNAINTASNILAGKLKNFSASFEQSKCNVAVLMDKHVDIITAMLGILKANFTYLLIDPTYPKERIEYMLSDSQCEIVILSDLQNHEISNRYRKIYINTNDYIDQSPKNICVENSTHQRDNPAACIIYTSGSTGKPKPVMISHTSILNLIDNQMKYFGVTTQSRILQYSSISFDAAVTEIWLTLLKGATLVIPGEKYLSGEFLEKIIIEEKISVLIAPPTILSTITRVNEVCHYLNTVVSAGEALTKAVLRKWQSKVKYFINGYGPTETTVCATFFVYNQSIIDDNIIGKPLDNVTVFILNEDLTSTPKGSIGEIYIGGEGVSLGYFNHPELNQKAFVPNPLDNGSTRLYKTGDLAVLLDNGNLQYKGRADRQIKFNGIRIELDEIENQLSTCNMVDLCAVCLDVNESNGEKKLVAYFTSHNHEYAQNELKKAIRQHMVNKLPLSIVPQHYILLEDLPRLPNGKIDRDKLKCFDKNICESNNKSDSLQTSVENQIAQVYSQVLSIDIPHVKTDMSFFELGGTSLMAITAISKINQCFNKSLSVDYFFNHSSIKELLKKLQSAEAELIDLYAKIIPIEVDKINTNFDFFELGGTSLSAITLISEIKKVFGVNLSVEQFFNGSSVCEIYKLISSTHNDVTTEYELVNQVNFYATYNNEYKLLEETINTIKDNGLPTRMFHRNLTIKNILLTGVTGFIGIYLLKELLEHSKETVIHCIIRAKDDLSAFERLLDNAKFYSFIELDFDRIKCYHGDTSLPKFGLSDLNYENLCSSIDTVYHAAAFVNHLYSYEKLRNDNVQTIFEMINFLCKVKIKSLNFVSALDVALIKSNNQEINEEINTVQNLMGYIQTKWMSEILLTQASSALNLTIKIYRPGNVIGDLKNGIMDPRTNHFLMLTKGCIQLKTAPNANFWVEMVPVDVLAESIVKLAVQNQQNNISCYNLHNPKTLSWTQYINLLCKLGYNIQIVDLEQWLGDYLPKINNENALFPFKEYYMKNKFGLNTGYINIPNSEFTSINNNLRKPLTENPTSLVTDYIEQLKKIRFF